MSEFQDVDIAKKIVAGFLLTESKIEAIDTFNQVLTLLDINVQLGSEIDINGDRVFIWKGGTSTDISNAVNIFNLIVDYIPLKEVYSAAKNGNLMIVISKFSNLLKDELRRAETLRWLNEFPNI